jgi:cytochrome c-type biogenesis protein CcmH/NrfF
VALVIGGGLILIGIPLLLLEGIGCIPILLGIIVLVTALIISAVASSQQAAAFSQISVTPNNCPQCRNHSIIPANSPNAQMLIASTPHLRDAAQAEIESVRSFVKGKLLEG